MTRDHNENCQETRMKRNCRVLFGPLAGAILFFGIAGLALLIPGYSHMQQTVSEIGEIGSPARVPFAIMLCCVAACILVFASAVRDLSVMAYHSRLAAYRAFKAENRCHRHWPQDSERHTSNFALLANNGNVRTTNGRQWGATLGGKSKFLNR